MRKRGENISKNWYMNRVSIQFTAFKMNVNSVQLGQKKMNAFIFFR